MEQLHYVLVAKGDDAYTPYRFWEWDIQERGAVKAPWHFYEGSPSLIPVTVMQQIAAFEQRLGRSIRRPIMHGDTKTYTAD